MRQFVFKTLRDSFFRGNKLLRTFERTKRRCAKLQAHFWCFWGFCSQKSSGLLMIVSIVKEAHEAIPVRPDLTVSMAHPVQLDRLVSKVLRVSTAPPALQARCGDPSHMPPMCTTPQLRISASRQASPWPSTTSSPKTSPPHRPPA